MSPRKLAERREMEALAAATGALDADRADRAAWWSDVGAALAVVLTITCGVFITAGLS